MKTAEWNERQRGAWSISGTGNEWRRAGWWSELRCHVGGCCTWDRWLPNSGDLGQGGEVGATNRKKCPVWG